MEMWYAAGLFILFFVLLYANYGNFAKTIVRWSKKPIPKKGSKKIVQPKLTAKELILCYIPFVQCCVVRKALYRRSTVCNVFSGISAFLIIARLINTFLLPINSYVMFFTSIGIFVGLFIHLLTYGIVTADCAKMYGYSWFMIILCFILPMIACWWATTTVPYRMQTLYQKEIFNERNADTVIKRKRSK